MKFTLKQRNVTKTNLSNLSPDIGRQNVLRGDALVPQGTQAPRQRSPPRRRPARQAGLRFGREILNLVQSFSDKMISGNFRLGRIYTAFGN